MQNNNKNLVRTGTTQAVGGVNMRKKENITVKCCYLLVSEQLRNSQRRERSRTRDGRWHGVRCGTPVASAAGWELHSPGTAVAEGGRDLLWWHRRGCHCTGVLWLCMESTGSIHALAFVGHGGEGVGMSDCKEQRDKEPSPLENGLEMRGARSLSTLHDGADALEVTLSLTLLRKHPSQMCP